MTSVQTACAMNLEQTEKLAHHCQELEKGLWLVRGQQVRMMAMMQEQRTMLEHFRVGVCDQLEQNGAEPRVEESWNRTAPTWAEHMNELIEA